MNLPRTCPIGFTFHWDGDCPGQPLKVWTYVGRGELGMPRFDSGEGDPVWSMRLEEVAAREWEESRRLTLEVWESLGRQRPELGGA